MANFQLNLNWNLIGFLNNFNSDIRTLQQHVTFSLHNNNKKKSV